MTTPEEVVARSAELFSVSEESIWNRDKHPEASWARQVAWYVLNQRGMSLMGLARAFGRDHSTVHHGVRRVEKRIRADAAERAAVLDVMGEFDASTEAGMYRLLMAEREHAKDVLERLDALICRLESRAQGRRRTLVS